MSSVVVSAVVFFSVLLIILYTGSLAAIRLNHKLFLDQTCGSDMSLIGTQGHSAKALVIN